MQEPLSTAQAAVLDAAADRLVPRDEHGAGALDAQATRYIRRGLSEALGQHAPAYRAGLDALEARARAEHEGRGFCALDPSAQDALLTAVEQDEPIFFMTLWTHLLEGLLGDPAWGGNADAAGWRLIGYDGPRLIWSARDQRIGARSDDRLGAARAPDSRGAEPAPLPRLRAEGA